VAAIIYGFVGTDWTTLPNRLQPGPKLQTVNDGRHNRLGHFGPG